MQKPQFLLQLLLLACHCLGLRHWGQISSARSFQLKKLLDSLLLISLFSVTMMSGMLCPPLAWFWLVFSWNISWGKLGVSLFCSLGPCWGFWCGLVFNVIMNHKINFFLCVSYIYISFFQICYHELIFMNLNYIRVFLIVQKIFIMSKANKYKHQQVQLQTELQGSPTSTRT